MKNAKSLSWLLVTILLTTAPFSEAQQPAKVPRIGFQLDSPVSAVTGRIEGFRQGLRELGYIEGKTIIIEWRSSEGKVERRGEIAAELVRLKVDVIVSGGPTVTRAIKEQLRRFPSSWGRIPTRSAVGSPPAWPGRAATSRDCRLCLQR